MREAGSEPLHLDQNEDDITALVGHHSFTDCQDGIEPGSEQRNGLEASGLRDNRSTEVLLETIETVLHSSFLIGVTVDSAQV